MDDSANGAALRAPSSGSAQPTFLRPGEHVGRIRVLEEIGQGGMGVVYLGRDETLGRQVALKVVGAGGDARRLVAEARALAQLSHPNVVEIFEVLTHGDRVVLAMAYVRGPTLRQWTRQRDRTWHEVLATVVDAGHALAAAHRAGLLHRDVKPSNIIVGDDGRARLVDFGLSCAAERAVSVGAPQRSIVVDSIATETGVLVGTPPYMAPELLVGGDPSPTSDQYALCVTLYECLWGTRPWQELDTERLLRAKLRGPMAAPNAGDAPRWLRRAIERGLSPDPADRFPTMEALLRELSPQRHRARRRALAVLGLVTLAMGLVALPLGGAAMPTMCSSEDESIDAVWSTDARGTVRENLARAGASADDLRRIEGRLDAFASDWEILGEHICAASDADATDAPERRRQSECLGWARRDFGHVVEALGRDQAEVLEHAWRVVGSLPDPRRCADGQWRAAPGGEHAASDTLGRARALARAGAYADAEALLDDAALEAHAATDPLVRAALELAKGELANFRAAFVDAERHFQEAYFLGRRARDSAISGDAAIALVDVVGVQQARHDDGARWVRHAEAELAPGDRRLGHLLAAQGNIAAAQGDFAAAIELHTRALDRLRELGSDAEADIAVGLNDLAIVHAQAGDLAMAEPMLRAALDEHVRTSGPDHPALLEALVNLGAVQQGKGELDAALATFDRALAIGTRTWGLRHPRLVRYFNNLGVVHAQKGDAVRAAEAFEQALTLGQSRGDPHHPEVAATRTNLALALSTLGRHDEAIVHAETALTAFERTLGPDHMRVAQAKMAIASCREARGRAASK